MLPNVWFGIDFAYLGESENVVNEEQHILSFLVTEIFGDGETGKGDTGTGSWGLVHLSYKME